MANVANNFLQYGINARSAYSVNNAANAPAIGNWTAVKVDAFLATTSGFAAQLYTDGQGNYRVAMRGTDELRGDLPPDVALATGRWHGQMTDAIRFMGEAILQIKASNAGRALTFDQIRDRIDGSGHSLGGSLYELSGKFWGTRGMNIDGPGVVGQSGLGEFSALKTEFRVKGLTELQDNYNWQPGDFQSRTYTIIGSTGSHLSGAELYVSPKYENLNLAIQDSRSFYYVPSATTSLVISEGFAYIPLQLGSAIALHPMTAIFRSEGYADPEGSLRQQWIARNLANGLSASGYSAGSVQYEALGAGIAFQVTVIRDEQGRMVEIRVPGKLGNRTFETMGPPISSAARSNGAVENLGITDPASTIRSVVVSAVPELGTPARNSANYIINNGANSQSITVGTGGTISDIWLIQRNAGNKFTLEEFGRAILASNPEIADINQVRSGQIIYIPQKLVDGSVTYHYAGGTSINSNSQSGEYHMVVPNSAGGGQTVYSRTYDGNGTGGEGYTVRQVQTNAAGEIGVGEIGVRVKLS